MFSCSKPNVPIQSLSFTQDKVSLFKGQSKWLNLNILPENAQNFNIVWSSSNNEIVEVNNRGKITAKNYGFATVVAKVKDSDISCECKVVVNDGSVVNFEIQTSFKTYYEGQEFDLSTLKVYAVYESGARGLLNPDQYTLEYPQTLTLDSGIKVTYGEKSKFYYPLVLEDYVIEAKISSLPNKTSYIIGEEFDDKGTEVTLLYASGKEEITKDYTIENKTIQYKQTSVTIKYQDFALPIEITSNAEVVVHSIAELQKAIDEGRKSIMLSEGIYNTTTQIVVKNKNILLFGQNTTINGYDIIPIKVEGNCNLILDNITLASLGDNAQDYQLDLSLCTGGEIDLTGATLTSILQPHTQNTL